MTEERTALKLAENIQRVEPSPTLSITSLANALKAQGRDVVSFSAGQPDFDTPKNIKEAAKASLDAGQTGYVNVAGLPVLRQTIADAYNSKGHKVTPDNIVVSCGAKHSLYQLNQVLLDPDDEVIIPAPYWVSYPAQATLARAKAVTPFCGQDVGFKLTPAALEASITTKTRLLVLNTPSNPTGAVYSRKELEAIADIVLAHGIGVLYDSIYDELIYGDIEPVEFATLKPGLDALTITVNGLSKSHAMTGWRVGYIVAPLHVAKAVSKLQSQSTSCITSFVQYASIEAIGGNQDFIPEMRVHFDRRRRLMVDLLNDIPAVKCLEPQGAFYAFPDMSAYLGLKGPDGVIETDLELASFLLKEHNVALVPGSAFGAPGFMRLSYATDDASIEKGLARVREGLGNLS
jgi:aspartate aminotransferase